MNKKSELKEELKRIENKIGDPLIAGVCYRELSVQAIKALTDDEPDARIDDLLDHLDTAWGVIANAGWEEGENKAQGWKEAAEKWRDRWGELNKLCSKGKDDEPEKPFVPTEEGWYKYKPKNSGWMCIEVYLNDGVLRIGRGSVESRTGEWLPDRIPMPGGE